MIRQHHPIRTVVALSAIAAALLLAGCGGSSSSGKAGGAQTVRAAYVLSTVPGYQMDLKVTGSAAGHPINVTGTGAFDQATRDGRLTINVIPTPGAENLQFTTVVLGKDVYVKVPSSLAGDIPGGKPWVELNLSGIVKSPGLQGLSSLAGNAGENPAQFLHVLREDSTGGVQNLGQQTIDGQSTTRYSATFDLSKLAEDLPASQRQTVSSAIASMEKLTGLHYLPIEAWVDSSGRPRRVVISATGQVDGKSFSENIQIDFVRYGLEPVPAAPPANQVTNVMSLIGIS